MRSLIERAAAAKCSALVLTIDLQVLGQRHCDVRNGLTVPPEIRAGKMQVLPRSAAIVETVANCNPSGHFPSSSRSQMNCA